MSAYLVIRDGLKWSDVFPLAEGQTVKIGRAPSNEVVLTDERCSRCHAEVFAREGEWILRDLGSRNGTRVAERPIEGESILSAGDVIRIGRSQLAFVHDLNKAFTDSGVLARPDSGVLDDGDSSVLSAHEPTTITHRKGQTRFLEPAHDSDADLAGQSHAGKAAATLCRMAFALAQAPDKMTMAKIALDGLFEGTPVDTGAMLLMPSPSADQAEAAALEIIASRADTKRSYHRVSNFLASTVLREGEAVLARNVMGDSALARRDSDGEIHATSVLCAPIRQGSEVLGLFHLYSTDTDRVLEPEDLEFTLAVADTVAVALGNLDRRQELAEDLTLVKGENQQLRERLGVQSDIIGRSEVIRRITEEIARAAPSKATVLIRGESGVGKELVARAVHMSSPRSEGVFVCMNCAALTESLLESELFGHEKGAFTGATDRKIGKFEAAHKGTLMLDEIGEMSPTIQAKFLRVLEGHPFERVGGSEPVKVDVRVIAATNRDVERDVAEGKFRRDLYFRLKVLEIVVPALRKRAEDVPLLAEYFLEKYKAETGRRIEGYSPEAMEQMVKYRWPGNVRELKNVVERAVVLCQGRFIQVEDLVLSKLPTAGDTMDTSINAQGAAYSPTSLEEMEQKHIAATLAHTGWNKSRAANILGIERSTLDRKIKRYELQESVPRRGR